MCACPTRDAPTVNSCHGNNHIVTSSSSNTRCTSRQKLKGTAAGSIRHRRGIRRAKKKSSHHKQQQSLESLVNTVQQMKGLDKDDTVDERNGLYKFTVCHIAIALCIM